MPTRYSTPAQDLPEDRDGFRFRASHAALDLTATLAARLKPVSRELLETPADLNRWLRSSGLVRTSPQATADDLDQARRLREAIYDLAMACIGGEPSPQGARTILNRAASETPAIPKLDRDGGMRLEGSARSLLASVAREAVGLLGGAEAGQIRQCSSDTCAILFIDTSRSGERRWCSMAGCGNKAKVAEFRRRKREAR